MNVKSLRRVEVETPEGDRLVFLTNHLDLGATTVARIYKDRWQIELFFKAASARHSAVIRHLAELASRRCAFGTCA
jgi:hypothetical protein